MMIIKANYTLATLVTLYYNIFGTIKKLFIINNYYSKLHIIFSHKRAIDIGITIFKAFVIRSFECTQVSIFIHIESIFAYAFEKTQIILAKINYYFDNMLRCYIYVLSLGMKKKIKCLHLNHFSLNVHQVFLSYLDQHYILLLVHFNFFEIIVEDLI